MEERVQKLMAQAGIASRRDAEELIAQGRVTVNGHVAKLGDKADPSQDEIRVDGERLRIESARVYIMINKPMGIVTAVRAQEQETRRTVRELIPIKGYLYPVGRLDADSEGLVILTNDGELAQKLTHPRYEHPKVYEVTLIGSPSEEALDIWRRGVMLDDGPTKSVEIKVLSRERDTTQIQVIMREGRKRQIRRIANTLGHPVQRLVRVQFDTLNLGNLGRGEWRYLTDAEIRDLQESAVSTRRSGTSGPRPSAPKPPSQPRASRTGTSTRRAITHIKPSSGGRGPARSGNPRRSSTRRPTKRAEYTSDERQPTPHSTERSEHESDERGPARPGDPRHSSTQRPTKRAEYTSDERRPTPRSTERSENESDERRPARPSGARHTPTRRPTKRAEYTSDERRPTPHSTERSEHESDERRPARPSGARRTPTRRPTKRAEYTSDERRPTPHSTERSEHESDERRPARPSGARRTPARRPAGRSESPAQKRRPARPGGARRHPVTGQRSTGRSRPSSSPRSKPGLRRRSPSRRRGNGKR